MVFRVRELDLRIDYGGVATDGTTYYPLNERAVPLMQQANDLIALGVFFSYLKLIKYIRLFPTLGPAVQVRGLSLETRHYLVASRTRHLFASCR